MTDSDGDARFELFEDLIEDNTIPLFGLRILSYLDEEGEERFVLKQTGTASLTLVIGLLDVLRFELNLRHAKKLRE